MLLSGFHRDAACTHSQCAHANAHPHSNPDCQLYANEHSHKYTLLDLHPHTHQHFHANLYTNLHPSAHPDAHTHFHPYHHSFEYTRPIRDAHPFPHPLG